MAYFVLTLAGSHNVFRAAWVDLTGDGRKSILTARALSPLGNNANNNKSQTTDGNTTRKPKSGQLVCLEMPRPHRFDEATGTPLERDGTVFDPLNPEHLPWKTQYVPSPFVGFTLIFLGVFGL